MVPLFNRGAYAIIGRRRGAPAIRQALAALTSGGKLIMATQTKELTPEYRAHADDPYHLTTEGIQEPRPAGRTACATLAPG
jgi:hypothetical protein